MLLDLEVMRYPYFSKGLRKEVCIDIVILTDRDYLVFEAAFLMAIRGFTNRPSVMRRSQSRDTPKNKSLKFVAFYNNY